MSDHAITVVGTGFAGLTVAATLAQEGHTVRCLGDGRPGPSLANFGQLHSGAVYAPVLPAVAAACWEYRSRWYNFIDGIDDARHGIGLFALEEHAERYLSAWRELCLPVLPLTARQIAATLGPIRPLGATAFALPDLAVNPASLHARLAAYVRSLGVAFRTPSACTLRFDGALASVMLGDDLVASGTIVLCGGAMTPAILDQAGIKHRLSLTYLPYGHVAGNYGLPLTYWLDEDLLALSPTPGGVNLALPGRSPHAESSRAEQRHLAASVARHWPNIDAHKLVLRRGIAAELAGLAPDPSVHVMDLRHEEAADGRSRVENLIICLPGKWTTAWHAADLVAAAIRTVA